ncbi:MAG TPA: MYXO-CTERM sorting domain-containing protein [Polyangia bacterium]|nr:MYXO-CTERM sorting domain-containing protein [Polyangia bacterium]
MLAGILVAGSAGAAHAVANPTMCKNDNDCVADPQCGGSVCSYATNPPSCVPADPNNQGMDGWCTGTDTNADSECKCHAQGAKCMSVYCTFTVPMTGGAGSSGTAGSSAAGSNGTAGSSAAGSNGTAGSTGTAGKSTTSSSGGGCAVAPTASGGLASLFGLALVAGGLVRRRRRG